MRRTPPSSAFGLSRTSTGLTTAHRELIRLLAERAVQQYLDETEATDDAPADDQEVSR